MSKFDHPGSNDNDRDLRVEKSIEMLIPWYLNSTLSEAEMNRVTTALTQSDALTSRIEEELRFAERLHDAPPELDQILAQENQGFAALQHSLESAEKKPKYFAAPVLIAASVLIFLGLAVISPRLISPTPTDDYRTLTTPPANTGTPVLQVVFAPDITERELRLLLLDAGGQLLGSPSASGVYRIALPTATDGEAYARRLQQHPAVRWAEVEAR